MECGLSKIKSEWPVGRVLHQDSERHNKQLTTQIGLRPSQHLLVFTKHAKCMTLSVLETSLPMQRSHDTLTLDISA